MSVRMAARRGFLPRWSGRSAAGQPVDGAVASSTELAPIPRAPSTTHHWLTLLVARPGPHEPVPVPFARVTVRAFPRGAERPGDVVARGTTRSDGTIELQLPGGRYAVSARAGEDGRHVTITLEHPGRALLLLENMSRRIVLTIEASRLDGRPLVEAALEVRSSPAGSVAARGVTDERGIVSLNLPPGAYEVRVGETVVRTYAEADTLLRLTAENVGPAAGPAASKYAQKVRSATTYVATYDVGSVREDIYN
jgi:hypothetical protein